jgi:ATP-dependent protease HslVU (ClpYQ) peptidase subunit
MSTVTIVRKSGQIAIAADTLAKWGGEKNAAKYVKNHNKIIKVGENYIAITGPAAGHHALSDYFARQRGDIKLRSISEIYRRWKDLHQVLKDEYHLETKEESESAFETNWMDILIANPYGIFAVGSHRDIQEFSMFYSYGSGNEYALGAMYLAYADKRKSAEEIARLGVEAAAEFDDATGQPIISYMMKAKNE